MPESLHWLQIVRLGLVQASIGAIVIFATSTLNRVMVVEDALPAIVPGFLVAFHYAVQMLRPRWGYGSDRHGRRTPFIVGGMAVLALGSVLAALAVAVMPAHPFAGFGLALVGYGLIGIGVGASGTALLVLLAKRVEPQRRAAAATIVWMMMITGFIATAALAGRLLAPFSVAHMLLASSVIAAGGLIVTILAIWGLEPAEAAPAAGSTPSDAGSTLAAAPGFLPALAEVWAEPEARRFTLFVFLSMLAYSAQELLLEPFAGALFGLPPAATAGLAGLQHGGLLGGMIVVAVFGSVIGGPRLGTMRLWTTGGCVASAAAILGLAATGLAGSAAALRLMVLLLGLANGTFSIAAVGAMMQLAGSGRPGREGVRMGLWGAAQAVAFSCGGLVGTLASDLARHLLGSADLAYGVIFVGEAVLFCCAAGLAARAFPAASAAPAAPVSRRFGAAPQGAAGSAG